MLQCQTLAGLGRRTSRTMRCFSQGRSGRSSPTGQTARRKASRRFLAHFAYVRARAISARCIGGWAKDQEARAFGLSWAQDPQYAHKHDKAVIELQKAFKKPDFFGPLPLSEIERLPQTWKEVLRNIKGIYLLTCPRTKEQYVGKADGQEGFLGRWEEYARNGHGGNVMLKNRERSDYQVSILEQAGTVFDFDEAEALWKRKLQTRQMGLNGN